MKQWDRAGQENAACAENTASSNAPHSVAHSTRIETIQTSPSPLIKSRSPYAFDFHSESIDPHTALCTITIPGAIVSALYEEAARSQKRAIHAPGFGGKDVPTLFIKDNFGECLTGHLKEFLLKFSIINHLYYHLQANQLITAGEPRLSSITLSPENDARFVFEIYLFNDLIIEEWRYYPFKAPQRKRYKDLDKQVQSLIQQESEAKEAYSESVIAPFDWVHFTIELLHSNGNSLAANLSSQFWFRVSNDEIESSLREVFLGKKIGDEIITNNQGLQDYFSHHLDSNYTFRITIIDIIPHQFFCIDEFKRHFRLKTKKDTHKKLIEVFSYHHHISQRREMVHEAFSLLLAKHPFEAQEHLIKRQQQLVLENVRENPDFNVYRMQPNFEDHVYQLAQRQVKESLLMDALSNQENMTASDLDVRGYMNLLHRQRTKEFIHFTPPPSKVQGQEMPVPAEELRRICLREKAINHVIYHLTKE